MEILRFVNTLLLQNTVGTSSSSSDPRKEVKSQELCCGLETSLIAPEFQSLGVGCVSLIVR